MRDKRSFSQPCRVFSSLTSLSSGDCVRHARVWQANTMTERYNGRLERILSRAPTEGTLFYMLLLPHPRRICP